MVESAEHLGHELIHSTVELCRADTPGMSLNSNGPLKRDKVYRLTSRAKNTIPDDCQTREPEEEDRSPPKQVSDTLRGVANVFPPLAGASHEG